MRRLRIVNLVLVALVALAAWRTAGVWRRGVPEVPAHADAAQRPASESLPAPPRKPVLPQMVTAIAEKDLFDASRKAPEVAPPAPERTPSPPPTLKLAGVLLIGTEREAVLTDTAQGNKQTRMREGEEISGYKVGKITSDQVSLVGGGGEEVVLSLVLDKSKTAKAKGFGPGGKPVAKPGAVAQPKPVQAVNADEAPPAQLHPGAFGPPGAVGGAAMQPPPDPRKRAESARERLKRLKAEGGAH